MRILYVIDFFHPHVGGVPTFFKNLTESVSKAGHSVTILTTHAKGTKRVERHGKVKIYRLGRTREQFMAAATMFLMRTRERFDVVHTSTYSAMVPAYALSVLRGVPEVLSVHEVWSLGEWTEFTGKKGPFYFLEERLLLKMPFDLYVSPSEHTKRDLEAVGIGGDRIRVIPHGIDTKVFAPAAKRARRETRSRFLIGQEELVGCFVGKATAFKGIDYLLDALESVMKRREMRFVFLLSRSHESGYRRFLRRVHSSEVLRRNVIVAQPSSDHGFTSRLVAACDFMVMPSLTEGFGLAAAEAAAMGVPVIATKGTSLTEVLDEGANSIFVRPRSSSDIAKAIGRLAGSRRLLASLSRGKRFDPWDRVAREYIKAYQDVIRKHKGDAVR